MQLVFWLLVLVGLDQTTKWWARNWLESPWMLWGDWLQAQLSFNDGIAFSLPLPTIITIPLTLLVVAYLGYYLYQKQHPRWTYFGLSMILAGAIGNFIDRVLFGAVTDFVSVGTFPIFNLADSFITVGVVLVLWQEVLGGES